MSKTRKDDLNVSAFDIVQQATGQAKPEESAKNPAAVELEGKRGQEPFLAVVGP